MSIDLPRVFRKALAASPLNPVPGDEFHVMTVDGCKTYLYGTAPSPATRSRIQRKITLLEGDDEQVFASDSDWVSFAPRVVGVNGKWFYGTWTKFADVGSIYVRELGQILQTEDSPPIGVEFYVKFEPGSSSDNWALQSRALPILDEQTLQELTEDELDAIFQLEDYAAMQRFKNVELVRAELARREARHQE